MSGSRCLVSERGKLSLGKPHSTRRPGNMPQATAVWPHLPSPTPRWWLLLWGVLQACPTQGSVLSAQPLPQKLASPGYPEPYVKGQESSTDIEAPKGFAVRLVFQDFDLEPSPDCERDSVTIPHLLGASFTICEITASGMDPSRFCGRQGSPLGSPPGQREFVSSGNSLRLTFRAPASEGRTLGLHKGFLAFYQAVRVNHGQPISQATEGPEATNIPGDNSTEIQSHCQGPYYQAMPAGTLTCTAQVPWKQTQDREEVPHCVPVCGRVIIPIAQNRESLGASRAELGNFPWQALTSIYGRGGGALLGDRWILTAAHTIYPKYGISLGRSRRAEVFLGHTDLDEMLELGGHPVRRVVVHPDYRQDKPHNFHGDIALLELQHRVSLGPHLLPVCLPDREALYRPGLAGYVSGFGVENGFLTTELKYSRLPVAPRAACEAWLREKRRTEVFSDSMFCAGDRVRPQGVCQGDSGGAYVVWDDRARRWVATGIVSWGIGCGEGYGFYTKVLAYVGWIRGVMGRKD
ncbi:complement C1r subcomponent-like protein isoform X1 [Hippopotamus amphibius kiboko]|uniref:complement C1r subcomponent-like protein isoform X1 n=1 Tax=Hippopotamus amphibius kiboko TaxID=575201 RepID=UPI0025935466|nr:complement C1r subcomponent-like protein isoform X1 [Hippopotamus amphibius kiboko]